MSCLKGISNAEFASMLRRVRLPEVKSQRLGVALSGGPDSVCLLFLLRRLALSRGWNDIFGFAADERSVVAFTVDHQLQRGSASVARVAAKLSESLNVPHRTSVIPWSKAPFPPVPQEGSAFESIARRARYHLLLADMERESVQVLCTGHHLDDQIETAVMRLNQGSSGFGLAGMRKLRRWGMGDQRSYLSNGLGWAGTSGMDHWIARPLLEVPKDRILATCHENELSYTIDKTNFQPALTARNGIRHALSSPDSQATDHPSTELVDAALHAAGAGGKAALGNDVLKDWVHRNVRYLDNADDIASAYFAERGHRPSPPSTMFVPATSKHVTPEAKLAIILRVLRYVSPNPWGCVSAESGRRSRSIATIVSRVLDGSSFSELPRERVPFSAGSGVLWTPVVGKPDGTFRVDRGQDDGAIDEHGEPWARGWLAQRLPPPSAQRTHRHAGAVTYTVISTTTSNSFNHSEENPAHAHRVYHEHEAIDICDTPSRTNEQRLDILFDCRFMIRIDLSLIPAEVQRRLGGVTGVSMSAVGQCVLPSIRIRGTKVDADGNPHTHTWELNHRYTPSGGGELSTGVEWVQVELARTLSAL